MLQQTQASRVVPAFERFIGAFPTVGALAAGSTADVVRAWDGLGYNRRAVALSRTARHVVRNLGGRFPDDPAELRRLPGIGPYTAAAVASIAFGMPVAAVDTNVRRIVARVFARSELSIDALASAWVSTTDPGAWNQALMDLGREVCRPVPRCDACPLRRSCAVAFGVRARPRAAPVPRQAAFEGSFRQLRGAIVREIRDGRAATIAALVAATGRSSHDVGRAVAALARDGLVDADARAVAGRASARVRLPTPRAETYGPTNRARTGPQF
jgi:A/G-specific adenine glycosylase